MIPSGAAHNEMILSDADDGTPTEHLPPHAIAVAAAAHMNPGAAASPPKSRTEAARAPTMARTVPRRRARKGADR